MYGFAERRFLAKLLVIIGGKAVCCCGMMLLIFSVFTECASLRGAWVFNDCAV